MTPLVEVHQLSRRFGPIAALDGPSFTIEAGEWVAVTGPSGSGKTTLLNILAGLDRPSAGRVRVGGVDLASLSAPDLARYRQRSVGLVFQQFHLIPYLTALENVMLAQYVHSMTDRPEAEAALAHVGLGDRLRHLPAQLSGGEQQRVCIARALINHPPLVLADEPTGNLDAANQAVVVAMLEDLHRRGHAVVLVTHDPALAARADRELRLEHGRLAAAAAGEPALDHLLAELWQILEEDGGRVSTTRRGVPELLAEGLLAAIATGTAGAGVVFTPPGRAAAASAVRRLRLAETLLARTLGHCAAECGRETPLAPGWEEQVADFLGQPELCPHGRRITPASLLPAPAPAVAGATAPEALPSARGGVGCAQQDKVWLSPAAEAGT
jgi:putative ABC transport system ATP-binding protein